MKNFNVRLLNLLFLSIYYFLICFNFKFVFIPYDDNCYCYLIITKAFYSLSFIIAQINI